MEVGENRRPRIFGGRAGAGVGPLEQEYLAQSPGDWYQPQNKIKKWRAAGGGASKQANRKPPLLLQRTTEFLRSDEYFDTRTSLY